MLLTEVPFEPDTQMTTIEIPEAIWNEASTLNDRKQNGELI